MVREWARPAKCSNRPQARRVRIAWSPRQALLSAQPCRLGWMLCLAGRLPGLDGAVAYAGISAVDLPDRGRSGPAGETGMPGADGQI